MFILQVKHLYYKDSTDAVAWWRNDKLWPESQLRYQHTSLSEEKEILSTDHVSKKCYISSKTWLSTTSKLWPPSRGPPLLLRTSEKEKNNNNKLTHKKNTPHTRQKPDPNIFGQQHLDHIKSWLGSLNPHAKDPLTDTRRRVEQDISTFVETQAVLFSPRPIREQEDAQGLRFQSTEQPNACKRTVTNTELRELCLAALAGKGHRLLILN